MRCGRARWECSLSVHAPPRVILHTQCPPMPSGKGGQSCFFGGVQSQCPQWLTPKGAKLLFRGAFSRVRSQSKGEFIRVCDLAILRSCSLGFVDSSSDEQLWRSACKRHCVSGNTRGGAFTDKLHSQRALPQRMLPRSAATHVALLSHSLWEWTNRAYCF